MFFPRYINGAFGSVCAISDVLWPCGLSPAQAGPEGSFLGAQVCSGVVGLFLKDQVCPGVVRVLMDPIVHVWFGFSGGIRWSRCGLAVDGSFLGAQVVQVCFVCS